MMEKRLSDLEQRISSLASIGPNDDPKEKQDKPEVPRAEALDRLESLTSTQKNKDGKRIFLLHRPTPDFEFEKFAKDNVYSTTENTEWILEIEAAESQQKEKNPVVSCLVPEDSVDHVLGAQENTGTWDKLGVNPNTTKFKIVVKPGKYQIHQELRQ